MLQRLRLISHRSSQLVAAAAMVLASVGLLGQASSPASAPAPETTLKYDVVSIREHDAKDQRGYAPQPDDGFIYLNQNLQILTMIAYGIRRDNTAGLSGWAESKHYDVQAKVSSEDVAAYRKLTREQKQEMLKQLLEENFMLKAHVEERVMPVYELVIAKGGAKFLKSADGGDDQIKLPNGKPMSKGMVFMGSGQLGCSQAPMTSFAGMLTNFAGRPVVDKTGLTGTYDLWLKWRPDQGLGSNDPQNDEPDLFTATEEQLGLKLQPARGPVKWLVVDHVEMPVAN